MNRTEFIIVTAIILLLAFALGWFSYWLLHCFTRVAGGDMAEMDNLAQSLHEAEELRDQALTYLEQREAELMNQISQTEAELRAADRAGGDVEPPAVEAGHRDLEAVTLVADQVFRRHAAVLEIHHRGRLRFPAELLLLRAIGESRRALLDHDRADAAALLLTRAHHADVQIVVARARDELLAKRVMTLCVPLLEG